MTTREFAEAMVVLSAAIDKPIGKNTLTAWYEFIKDLPAYAVTAAIHTIIATSEYPTLPAIGKIRNLAIAMSQPRRLSAPEAWGAVIKAMRHYGHYEEAAAIAALPEEAAHVAKLMGWQELCFAENIEVIRGQFLRMYDIQENIKRDEISIPPQARAILESARLKSLPEGQEKEQ